MSKQLQRLVLFTPNPFEMGGAGRRTLLLMKGLSEIGYEGTLIARSKSGSRYRKSIAYGITVYEIPGLRYQWLSSWAYLASAISVGLLYGFRARGFIGVQLLSQSMAAAACARLLRKPFVVLSSSSGEGSEVEYVRNSRSLKFRKAVLAKASRMFAQTSGAALELSQLFPHSRVDVLRNPVEIPVLPRNHLPRVLYCGRISSEKNIRAVLGAWLLVVARHPQARLWIVGAGGPYRSVEDQVRATIDGSRPLARSVVMTGWVSDPIPFYSSIDVFVLASTTEGMSNALVEASASSRIIVASGIEPNVDLLGETYPLLWTDHQSKSLAQLLIDAMTNLDVRQEALSHIEKSKSPTPAEFGRLVTTALD